MAVRITVDIFSGRANSVIEVECPEADEVVRRLKPGGKLSGREAADNRFSVLPDQVICPSSSVQSVCTLVPSVGQ